MLKQIIMRNHQRLGMMALMSAGPLLMVLLVFILVGIGHEAAPASAYAATGHAKTGPSSEISLSNQKKSSANEGSGALATNVKPAGKTATTSNSTKNIAAAVPISRTRTLYAYPNSNVAVQASALASGDPNNTVKLLRLAQTPMAVWLTGNNDQLVASNYVNAATSVGQIPQLVLYNIPERDCGSYSSGGASSPTVYQGWIDSVASAIGQRQAIVVVEPDALAGMDCLSGSDQQSRLQLINYAVQSLRNHTQAAIYIDAGNTNWQSVNVMAGRLQAAGVAEASGFSLNVSNFQTTASNLNYGSNLSTALGGKHFVIDTSRNGNGPTADNQWCNPDGRAFGNVPSLQTNSTFVDAYLWIKNPGESDGNCGPNQAGTAAPTAGSWWPQYALTLAANSGW